MGSKVRQKGVGARLHVLGCGEAFSADSGNTALWFQPPPKRRAKTRARWAQQSFLLDCGYQVPERFWRLQERSPGSELGAVLFTHLHADHAFGIVPLLARFWEESRVRPLWIAGPRGVEGFVSQLIDLGYPGLRARLQFSLRFHEWDSQRPWRALGVKISCAPTRHSVPNYALRMDGPGFSFSISGDGLLTPQAAELVSASELHFQECYTLKPSVPTHADLESTLALLEVHGMPKRLVLTHVQRASGAPVRRTAATLRRKGRVLSVARPGEVFPL